MKKRRSLFLFGTLAILASFSTGASAAYPVDMISPGLECRYYTFMGNDTVFDPAGFSANGLRNTAAYGRYAACPITKGTGYLDDTDSAWAILNASTATCQFWARGASYVLTKNPTSTTAVETGYYKYLWDDLLDYGTGYLSASIYCLVPGGGAIIQYGHESGNPA